jgi:hypothetical protein
MPGVRAKDMNAHYVGKKAKVREGKLVYEGTITAIDHRPDSTKISISLSHNSGGVVAVWVEGADMVELL